MCMLYFVYMYLVLILILNLEFLIDDIINNNVKKKLICNGNMLNVCYYNFNIILCI